MNDYDIEMQQLIPATNMFRYFSSHVISKAPGNVAITTRIRSTVSTIKFVENHDFHVRKSRNTFCLAPFMNFHICFGCGDCEHLHLYVFDQATRFDKGSGAGEETSGTPWMFTSSVRIALQVL